MSLADVAFLLGPLGAVVVVPLAGAVLATRRRPRLAVWFGTVLALMAAASWLAYWVLWGWAFDYADTFQSVPQGLEIGLVLSMATAAIGSIGVAVTAATAIVRSHPTS